MKNIEYVSLEDIHVDPAYQRRLNKSRVRQILNTFDDNLFQPVVVNERPTGELFIIDGQHRIAAATEKLGVAGKVPALVHRGLDTTQEAWLFAKLNSSSLSVGSIAKFWALKEAGDPETEMIYTIAHDCGFSITFEHSRSKATTPGQISAVGALYELARKKEAGGFAHLREVLEIIQAAWPEEKDAIKSVTLRGMSMFMANYGDRIDKARLIKRLQTEGLSQVMKRKESVQDGLNLSITTAFSYAILASYNHNLRAGNRLTYDL